MVTALGAVTTEAPQWQRCRRGGIQKGPKPYWLSDIDALSAATVQPFL
jgi:hypothetical protein